MRRPRHPRLQLELELETPDRRRLEALRGTIAVLAEGIPRLEETVGRLKSVRSKRAASEVDWMVEALPTFRQKLADFSAEEVRLARAMAEPTVEV